MNKSENYFLQTSKKANSEYNRNNSTNYLLEDSLRISNIKSPMTNSGINKNFNNTQNLLNEKTSMENQKKTGHIEESDDEEYLKTSFVSEYSENKNLIKSQTEFKFLPDLHNFEMNNSILLISPMSMNGNINQALENIRLQIEIDKSFMDFGILFPNENKSKILKLKNKSSAENSNCYIKFCTTDNLVNKIADLYSSDSRDQKVPNSLLKYPDCFSLEAGQCIERNISLKMNEEFEIEIFLKAPFLKNKESLISVLQIYHNKEFIVDIPLVAKIEIPKLVCLKEMYSPAIGFPLISIMLEIKNSGQKFRIPFKNLSIKEMEVEFILDQKNNCSVFTHDGSYFECQFMFFPKSLQLEAQSTSAVDLIAKTRRIKFDENMNQSKVCDRVRKIIIAKLKNSSIFYTFFVEAHFKKPKC